MSLLYASAPGFRGCAPKDIHNSEASKPAEAILRLNQLFNIESELEALPPDQKKKERLIREKPLLEAFWSWAEKSAIGELPKSKLSKAFHYALNNREGFGIIWKTGIVPSVIRLRKTVSVTL